MFKPLCVIQRLLSVSAQKNRPTWCGSVLGDDLPRHGASDVEKEIHSGRKAEGEASWPARVRLEERRRLAVRACLPSRSATPRFSPLFERHRSRAHTRHSMPRQSRTPRPPPFFSLPSLFAARSSPLHNFPYQEVVCLSRRPVFVKKKRRRRSAH